MTQCAHFDIRSHNITHLRTYVHSYCMLLKRPVLFTFQILKTEVLKEQFVSNICTHTTFTVQCAPTCTYCMVSICICVQSLSQEGHVVLA